jgi:redox-sensing transcriptional repressor
LNNFGGFGQQGYGYNVSSLCKEIGNLLGLESELDCVLIGAGNLGRAVANYTNFSKRGFKIKGIFDNSKEKIGTVINNIPVYSSDELFSFIRENNIKIAMLTLPAASIKELLEGILDAGIKGIWNFSYLEVDVPDDIALVNVHLSDSLMTLAYKIRELQKPN